ncbi:nose resistant to fluoxetine protein 6-like [Episyrphus balteatus]|uniref:nose resistant to fluoxetine protein 6-like n=1 Tax=Episyrphus balteatus TaxID=286459 RepID=UPI0024850ED3|nr:nose resistant to fluoxetine protein 6-like [Episyrphus balteatus]
MSNLKLTLFLVLTNLIYHQTHSISVINNVTVSSDFFQELFLKKIRLDFKLTDIANNADDVKNAEKCVLQLQEIVNQFPSVKVARFIDAWGKFPSGLLYGHLRDLGNYDQCVKTSVELNEELGIATGKYCMATFPLTSPINVSESDLSLLRETPLEEKIDARSLIKLRIGVCIPEICSPQIITAIFQGITENVLNGTLSGVKVSGCSVAKKPNYKAVDIFAIVLFSTIGGLMLFSSLYDCFTSYFERKPIQLLMAFSVITNGRKLFMINTKKSPNSIDCLTGIRVMSMIWVLHCHNYAYYASQNLINTIDVLSWYKKPWTMAVLMGTVSVDSFFFLSGLLLAWMGLRELDKTKGKLNVPMMYFHRYIRLTPALAAVILFYVTLNKYIGSGPFRQALIDVHSSCDETWWSTLLYVQNYATPNKMCVVQSWYLAIDTQLYVLSPLVLIPLWKWGKKFVPVLVILSLLSIGCIFATFISMGYTSLIGFGELDRVQKIYFPTHTRYSVWIVGICFGFFLHLNRQRSLRPPMIMRLLGWIICFGTLISIVFAPYFTISSDHSASVGHAAAYEGLKRVAWSLALAWIVFACHFGFGGLINSILSHPIWQPLGRLNYCMYLVHMAVQTINFGTVRTDAYFSDYRLYLNFWSTFGISVLVAILLSLSFEAPVLAIEKVLFATSHKKDDGNRAVLPTAPNMVSINGNVSKEV